MRRVVAGRGLLPSSRLAGEVRTLRERVEHLERIVGQLQSGQHDLGERQLREFDGVRRAVAAATDDLTARVNAVLQRVQHDS